jgi:hypothetical protein
LRTKLRLENRRPTTVDGLVLSLLVYTNKVECPADFKIADIYKLPHSFLFEYLNSITSMDEKLLHLDSVMKELEPYE